MIIAPTRSNALLTTTRLDARYFAAPAVRIRTSLNGLEDVELRTLGGPDGYARVRAPGRFKRTYAVEGEDFVSYLRPYDIFDFLPPAADRLSASRTDNVDDYMIRAGDLLQTCSGRNLGPLAIADAYLAKFALSHDMIRISIEDPTDRYYTLAFLRTPTGQHLLRGDLSGSVIDHITVDQVAAIDIPFLLSVRQEIANLIEQAATLREGARIRLDGLIDDLGATLPPLESSPRLADGWSRTAATLHGRLDAAYHDPAVASIRSALTRIGGVNVADVAETFIPSRYRRYYVGADYGRPIVSGRQLLQTQPINLRHIAARSFDFSLYELNEGMIAFGAEGRAEERIAQPALITHERASWLANNHVMRVRPRADINAGWLYLAFAVPQVQSQVKACSCGSVVDAVNPGDLDRVVLPPVDDTRGAAALECWQNFGTANELESEAIARLEAAIQRKIIASS